MSNTTRNQIMRLGEFIVSRNLKHANAELGRRMIANPDQIGKNLLMVAGIVCPAAARMANEIINTLTH